MSGLTDLKQTLRSLRIICDEVKYGFASIDENASIDRKKVLATFKEDGRLAIIAPQNYLESKGIDNEGPYARLTIDVHTSLELVGLTAVMSTELAQHGISANVVAGFYHDHVFVQYELREKAISILEGVKNN